MATFLCLLKQNIPLGCKDNKQPLEILDIFCNRYSNFLSKAFPIICYRKVLYTKVTKVFPVIAIAIPHNSALLRLGPETNFFIWTNSSKLPGWIWGWNRGWKNQTATFLSVSWVFFSSKKILIDFPFGFSSLKVF